MAALGSMEQGTWPIYNGQWWDIRRAWDDQFRRRLLQFMDAYTRTGSLGFWYSENPCGPWHEFYYTDYWTVDDPGNLTYQPKLSPKWISKNGKEMVLIWSDAMKNKDGRSHTVNYRWNHMKITIQTK